MEKLWLKYYQQGVPNEIQGTEYASLVELFLSSCQRHRDKIAYVNMGCSLTYQNIHDLSISFASYLQSLGLKKGDRIALMMPNILQYPVVLFGSLLAGLIVVNTNPLYTRDELAHQLSDSQTSAIVVLANFAHTLQKALPDIPSLKHIFITELGDFFPAYKRLLVNAVVRYLKKMVPAYHIPQSVKLNDALSTGRSKKFTPVSISKEETAFLQYTGGTTGVAKGAILSHANLLANITQAHYWISSLLSEDDVIVTALPLYHIFSLTANCLTFFKEGAKNILITNPRDIPRFIDEIKHSQFTTITGVNTLFNALLNHPKFKEIDFSKVKIALSGGMALQKSVSMRWQELTHSSILEAYGLTETSPAVTMNPMYLKEYNGSIGLPLPSTLVSIRDETGQELDVGEVGELSVKGPQVFSGYWNKPEETALVFWSDGYLRTGDIARMDEKGFIYLVDRKKDMILVSGFNVYPNEVEQVISMMPDVLEVGVVGIKDDNGDEKVKACVVKREPALTKEAIIEHCREHLAAYKVPKLIEFYTELPKSNVGKILRRSLKTIDSPIAAG